MAFLFFNGFYFQIWWSKCCRAPLFHRHSTEHMWQICFLYNVWHPPVQWFPWNFLITMFLCSIDYEGHNWVLPLINITSACFWLLHPETTETTETEQGEFGSRIGLNPLSSKTWLRGKKSVHVGCELIQLLYPLS